jgi:hypothetical protein
MERHYNGCQRESPRPSPEFLNMQANFHAKAGFHGINRYSKADQASAKNRGHQPYQHERTRKKHHHFARESQQVAAFQRIF